jgi:riboflavin synthase
MFTGLIEGLCKVKSAGRSGGGSMQVSIDLGGLSDGCKAGDSIAVSGVCLTIACLQGNIAAFDISGETLAKSTIESWRAGTLVNIERPLAADGRLGGHFVLGHVDGVAKVKKIEKKGDFVDMTFEADKEIIDNMIEKGSVAVDGVSLTISKLNKDGFTAALIPETLNRTTLGKAKTGDKINIETDLIVKTIKGHLEQLMPKQGLTIEKLRELGY